MRTLRAIAALERIGNATGETTIADMGQGGLPGACTSGGRGLRNSHGDQAAA